MWVLEGPSNGNVLNKMVSVLVLKDQFNVLSKVVSVWVLEGLLTVLDKVLSVLALPVANVPNK